MKNKMKNKMKKMVCKNLHRLIIVFLITVYAGSVFAQASSSAQVRKNVAMNGVAVQKLVNNLSKKFNYSFFIVDESVANTLVSVNKKNATVNDILNDAFKDKNITYAVRGNNITISKSNVKTVSTSATNSKMQQKQRIVGKITDENGEAVIGASVIEVGEPGNGTVTDVNGNFSLDVTPGALVKVNYIGYLEQTVTTAGKSSINVFLQEDTKALDEVVVIGYGTVAKRDLTGSVASVSNRQFKDQPIKNTAEILQGRTTGVEVTSTSGMPGGAKRVRVRGLTSINKSNDPLYIVDGVAGGTVKPEDIKSVEVLKDASATAIYGSRGANGVILITTRSGEAGKNKVEFSSYTGISNFPKKYDLMNAYEYAQALNDIKGSGTISDADMKAYKDGTKGVNYYDLLTQTGLEQDYRLSFSGGTDKLLYRISGNVVNQDAITITTNRKSYYLRSNVDAQVTPWLKFYTKLNASRTHDHNNSVSLAEAISYSPTMELKDEETGVYNKDPFNSIKNNPYGERISNYNDGYSNSLQANGNLVFSIVDGLTYSLQGAYNYDSGNGHWFTSKYRAPGERDDMGVNYWERRTWQNINNLTYANKFGAHALTTTAVWELFKSEYTNLTGKGSNLANGEIVGYWDITNAATRSVSNGYVGHSMASGLLRVMYNYDGRYYLTGSLRADGSSKFQGDNKWGYFPSAAVAWDMAQEAFMKERGLFQQLKLRASYGVTGNQGIDPYATMSMLSKEAYPWGTDNLYTGY